ncbi:hypothetical protein ADL35_14750 [Streptomyces sp. NRRL WC-3753]|nr:hypothetical protein ADL35_14750 [Streptomyces sp. NRRL WC-3753]
MDAGLITPAVIIAALVVRTALTELRSPGTARTTWAFARNWAAATAGAAVAAGVTLAGGDPGALAWGLLAGALTGHLVHQVRSPDP